MPAVQYCRHDANLIPYFERNFVRNEQIKKWRHAKEQLVSAFTRALEGANEVARARGFEFHATAHQLVLPAVAKAMAANDHTLKALIAKLNPGS
jgi:hypothetical protein